MGRRHYSKKQIHLFSTAPFFSLQNCISYIQQRNSLTACKSHDNLCLLLQLSVFQNLLDVYAMLPITVKQDCANGQNGRTTGTKSPLFLPCEKVVLFIYLRLWKIAGIKSVPAGRRTSVLPSSRCHQSTAVVALKYLWHKHRFLTSLYQIC